LQGIYHDHRRLLSGQQLRAPRRRPRLILSDWLDEHGDPDRTEFIRVQCELARLPNVALGAYPVLAGRSPGVAQRESIGDANGPKEVGRAVNLDTGSVVEERAPNTAW